MKEAGCLFVVFSDLEEDVKRKKASDDESADVKANNIFYNTDQNCIVK